MVSTPHHSSCTVAVPCFTDRVCNDLILLSLSMQTQCICPPLAKMPRMWSFCIMAFLWKSPLVCLRPLVLMTVSVTKSIDMSSQKPVSKASSASMSQSLSALLRLRSLLGTSTNTCFTQFPSVSWAVVLAQKSCLPQ